MYDESFSSRPDPTDEPLDPAWVVVGPNEEWLSNGISTALLELKQSREWIPWDHYWFDDDLWTPSRLASCLVTCSSSRVLFSVKWPWASLLEALSSASSIWPQCPGDLDLSSTHFWISTSSSCGNLCTDKRSQTFPRRTPEIGWAIECTRPASIQAIREHRSKVVIDRSSSTSNHEFSYPCRWTPRTNACYTVAKSTEMSSCGVPPENESDLW